MAVWKFEKETISNYHDPSLWQFI